MPKNFLNNFSRPAVSQMLSVVIISVFVLLSLGYILWNGRFAEIHLRVPYLNFPVFIGEFVMLLGLFLFLFKEGGARFLSARYFPFFAYAGVIFLKAFLGYYFYGPLALRHAAMFYYPLFAFLVYYSYEPRMLHSSFLRTILFVLFAGICFFQNFHPLYTMALFFSVFTCALKFPYKKLRYVLLAGLCVFLPWKLLFQVPRTMFVANIISTAFLVFCFLRMLRVSPKLKLIGVLLIAVLFVFGFIKFADRARLKSVYKIKRMDSLFQQADQKVQKTWERQKYKRLVWGKQGIQLYAPEKKDIETKKINLSVSEKEERPVVGGLTHESHQGFKKYPRASMQNVEGAATSNILFRLFVWRDLLRELIREKALFGFAFGKPLQPFSLQALRMAEGEWLRDGWIGAHNSFLEAVYRFGIAGIAAVFYLLFWLWKMTKLFLKRRFFLGIILIGLLINFFVAANFLMILELPYTAIPVWITFGLTVFYYQKVKKNTV